MTKKVAYRSLADAERLSSAPEEDTGPVTTGGQPMRLGVWGWIRWFWRQLTSMRVALLLLFLLSLAAIPGSLVPQKATDPLKVEDFIARHKTLAPLYEKLGLFHVFSSPWFSAIYILLFISLAGCIIPRSWQFVGVLRSRPPVAPRQLTRLPVYTTWRTERDREAVLADAQRVLKRRRFRTHSHEGAVASEKGYLREAGNLLFHISLFGLLIAIAVGHLWSFSGGKLVVEGDSFSNVLTQYDDYTPGPLYNADDLDAFGFTLDRFNATFAQSGSQRGTARTFEAQVTYWTGTDGAKHLRKKTIEVNEPLELGGSKVYLIGHGYAPYVTIRDGKGNIAFRGPVACLPLDQNITSNCVIKAPDAFGKNGKLDQLAFAGIFAPTAQVTAGRGPHSVFPELDRPAMYLTAYHGDLGLDSGAPQSVYQLDLKRLRQFKRSDGTPMRGFVLPKQTVQLPGGAGSLTFDRVQEWATFEISHHPGKGTALASSVLAILGLVGSLFIQRRRVWVRATTGPDGHTIIEIAELGRSESARIADELLDIAIELQTAAPALAEDEPTAEGEPDPIPAQRGEPQPQRQAGAGSGEVPDEDQQRPASRSAGHKPGDDAATTASGLVTAAKAEVTTQEEE